MTIRRNTEGHWAYKRLIPPIAFICAIICAVACAITLQPASKAESHNYLDPTEPITVKYQTSNIPVTSWHNYSEYEIASSATDSAESTLGVYKIDISEDDPNKGVVLIDEIKVPIDGVNLDVSQYVNGNELSDTVGILITLRSSAFDINKLFYVEPDTIISMGGIALWKDNDELVCEVSSSDAPYANFNGDCVTLIDAPLYGIDIVKTVNDTAFAPVEPSSLAKSAESQGLLSLSSDTPDELIDIVANDIAAVKIGSTNQTYAFSNLVSGAVFEITSMNGTKHTTVPTNRYGDTYIPIEYILDLDDVDSIEDLQDKLDTVVPNFTIQEVIAPRACELDDTVYEISYDLTEDSELIPNASPDNGTIHFYYDIIYFDNTGKNKSVTVEKVADLHDDNNNGIADSGEIIDYTFYVTNDGADFIANMTLEDPMLGLVDDDAIQIKNAFDEDMFARPERLSTYDVEYYYPNVVSLNLVAQMQTALGDYMLFPGETVKIQSPVSYTVTDDDVAAGIVSNEVTFTGRTLMRLNGKESMFDIVDEKTTADDQVQTPTKSSQPSTQKSSLSIVKEADKDTMTDAEAGDVITYTFTVTNTGDTELSDVDIIDELIEKDGADIDTSSIGTLEAGKSATVTAEYAVTDDDISAGIVTNVATATATDSNGDEVESIESKAVTTLERTTTPVNEPQGDDDSGVTADEVSDDDETLSDIVQTGVSQHGAQIVLATATVIFLGIAIICRRIMKK